MKLNLLTIILPLGALLTSCASTNSSGNFVQRSESGKLISTTPTVEQRKSDIANEPKGSHFIGRRYFVNRTSFWGYIRKPGESWNQSKLSLLNEWSKLGPDRLSQDGPTGARFGYNQNYEYKLWGKFTGAKVYDPNFNSFLPEFKLTNYQLISKTPGWIFTPNDKYDPDLVSLRGN